jgi:hypothetical protein
MVKSRSVAPIIAALLLLLPVLYVGSYLALIVPERFVTALAAGVIETDVRAEYRLGGDIAKGFFWPLEKIDRKVRLRVWNFSIDARGQISIP